MRMFLISDNVDTRTGMRLAGIEGVVVHERREIEDALNAAIQDESIGIILITELLAERVEDLIRDYRLNRSKPLIVEIPDRHGTRRPADYIMRYVNEAIGLKV
ncbi:V-type ATP synthase subunit F [Thermoclostridium caenicola]|uniref:V/A-type H+-transporting ATPase subunit F n=1 Tax=Thermoclostridium caenicola TaxID=659425 RepID=A0A1M6BJF2_9FIRM|nr:V-type ATP synthase subunit F [Thermoclostridium caenicola]SHI48851.1 V/A-type H+-transporting ATPase subunit F [Thermoclostridium caenicola]HOL84662.1 V-type ATP synthase subunit F [Thermoclostridium caenicola]HPO76921.1 V-type ATP synthase subunit F [Thermoclostridium caenicola]